MSDKGTSGSPTDTTSDTKPQGDVAPSGDTPASPAADAAAAADTSDKDKPAEKTGLDIVREVLARDAEPAKSSDAEPAKTDAEKATEAAKADDKSGEDVEEADKALPFHKHPRFQDVTRQRREALGKVAELEKARTEAEPLLTFGSGVVSFMQKNDLSGENVSELLNIGALIRSDPAKGREAVKAVLDALDAMLGETLPADLQARVDDGDISEDDAKALSKAKAAAALAKSRAEGVEAASKATSDAQAQAQTQKTVVDAVNLRLSVLRKADPDFAAKEKLLDREIKARMHERGGKPYADPNEAVKMLTEAHKHVGEILAATQPKPGTIDPLRSKDNGGNDKLAPLPATATGLEVTRRALGL